MFKNLKKKLEDSGENLEISKDLPILPKLLEIDENKEVESTTPNTMGSTKYCEFNTSLSQILPTSSSPEIKTFNIAKPKYIPQSDIESECGSEFDEDLYVQDMANLDVFSKEQLFYKVKKVLTQLTKYRGRYSEVTYAYKTLEKEREKMQNTLSQFQDKTLRRIQEMQEASQLNQQAKEHLEFSFRSMLEEKDAQIHKLQQDVEIMQKALNAKDQTTKETDNINNDTLNQNITKDNDTLNQNITCENWNEWSDVSLSPITIEPPIIPKDEINDELTNENIENHAETKTESEMEALDRLRSNKLNFEPIKQIPLGPDPWERIKELEDECGQLRERLQFMQNQFINKVNEKDLLDDEITDSSDTEIPTTDNKEPSDNQTDAFAKTINVMTQTLSLPQPELCDVALDAIPFVDTTPILTEINELKAQKICDDQKIRELQSELDKTLETMRTLNVAHQNTLESMQIHNVITISKHKDETIKDLVKVEILPNILSVFATFYLPLVGEENENDKIAQLLSPYLNENPIDSTTSNFTVTQLKKRILTLQAHIERVETKIISNFTQIIAKNKALHSKNQFMNTSVAALNEEIKMVKSVLQDLQTLAQTRLKTIRDEYNQLFEQIQRAYQTTHHNELQNVLNSLRSDHTLTCDKYQQQIDELTKANKDMSALYQTLLNDFKENQLITEELDEKVIGLEKERTLLMQDHAINVKTLKDDFDKRIAELDDAISEKNLVIKKCNQNIGDLRNLYQETLVSHAKELESIKNSKSHVTLSNLNNANTKMNQEVQCQLSELINTNVQKLKSPSFNDREDIYAILHQSDECMKRTIDEYDKKLEAREREIADLKNLLNLKGDQLISLGPKLQFYLDQCVRMIINNLLQIIVNRLMEMRENDINEFNKLLEPNTLWADFGPYIQYEIDQMWKNHINQLLKQALTILHEQPSSPNALPNGQMNNQALLSPQTQKSYVEHEEINENLLNNHSKPNIDSTISWDNSANLSPVDSPITNNQHPFLRSQLNSLASLEDSMASPTTGIIKNLAMTPNILSFDSHNMHNTDNMSLHSNSTLNSPNSYSQNIYNNNQKYDPRQLLMYSRKISDGSNSGSINQIPPLFPETSELEYLRKIVYEYIMGQEPLTMAKVLSAVLKFSPEKSLKIIEKEKSRQASSPYRRW